MSRSVNLDLLTEYLENRSERLIDRYKKESQGSEKESILLGRLEENAFLMGALDAFDSEFEIG